MNRRRGFTLIEMLVVLAVSSVLLGITAVTLHGLLINQNSGRERLQSCRNINRLAEQFRNDAHARQEISAGGKEGIVEMAPASADGITISWQCFADRIERTERKGEKVISRETYMLPPATEAALQLQSQPDASVACILILPKQEAGGLLRAPAMRIETVVGLDSRLAKIQAPGEVKP
jgi:prepilin-type N-terminal cleavage/methylation domain-containing protein